MSTPEQIHEAVVKGASVLDQYAPGWVDKIDTSRLHLESSWRCVLGQVYGEDGEAGKVMKPGARPGYYTGVQELAKALGRTEAVIPDADWAGQFPFHMFAEPHRFNLACELGFAISETEEDDEPDPNAVLEGTYAELKEQWLAVLNERKSQ